MKKYSFIMATVIAVCCIAGPTHAGNLSGQVIVAQFSNPVLSGNIIDGASGALTFFDNTSSAFYPIVNSSKTTLTGTPPRQSIGSDLIWGTGTATPNTSELVFFGASVPSGLVDGQVFDLGTLTYNNGTSDLNSLIFGATMTFFLASNDVIIPGSIAVQQLGINTTQNDGTAQQNADYITLSGLPNKSLNVLEGYGATAELFGYIIGDPQLTVTNIVLNPGQDDKAFIGNGQPVPTPEPSITILLGTGLVGLAFARRRGA